MTFKFLFSLLGLIGGGGAIAYPLAGSFNRFSTAYDNSGGGRSSGADPKITESTPSLIEGYESSFMDWDNLWNLMDAKWKTHQTSLRELPIKNELQEVLKPQDRKSWRLVSSSFKNCYTEQFKGVDCGYLQINNDSQNYKLKISYEGEQDNKGSWRVYISKLDGSQTFSNFYKEWKISEKVSFQDLTMKTDQSEIGWQEVSSPAFKVTVENFKK